MSIQDAIVNESRKINMSDLQLNALLGTILADAHIGASGATTTRVRWNHSSKQHEYCLHKYKTLKEFATNPPRRKPTPGYGEEWSCLSLKATHLYFLLRQLCCSDKQKRITREYLELMTHPIALAWMMMDKGSRQTGANAADLAMHAFPKEDVELFQQWLSEQWGVVDIIQTVHHSSTGKESWVLRFNKEAFLKLSALITPHIPEFMRYKTEIVTKTCPVCGTAFTLTHSDGCSPECAEAGKKQHKREYWQKNKDHFNEKSREWKKAHREEINARAREATRNLSPEKRQELNEYAARYRDENREKINAYRRERWTKQKGDPDHEAKLKEERRRYYERKKSNPERYQKSLAAVPGSPVWRS